MNNDRITVSLDKDSRNAIEYLTNRTGQGQSELIRQSLKFYAADFGAANAELSKRLEKYHKVLSAGEYVPIGCRLSPLLLALGIGRWR